MTKHRQHTCDTCPHYGMWHGKQLTCSVFIDEKQPILDPETGLCRVRYPPKEQQK